MKQFFIFLLLPVLSFIKKEEPQSWIRINQLGYTPNGIKQAVWCSKGTQPVKIFFLIDSASEKVMYEGNAENAMGEYGPFKQTQRLNFSAFTKPGTYRLIAGGSASPYFKIDVDVYKGAADFCLRYMRQQRTGFNPYLKDSCHTHDGYVLYGEKAGIKDSTHIDVVGGWHDASDYLQYSTTSANATYHLLMAYRDFPKVFTDEKQANGLDGKNGMADVLDEAKWGLDWLLKMHPRPDWMFNQIGDDRDHISMRIPKEDTQYGKGFERPVYFVSGEPQQRGKFMNATTGTSSTAGKFASAFALAHTIYETDSVFKNFARKNGYLDKAIEAYIKAVEKPGVTQTASVRSPYIYAEDNWVDDMELAAIALSEMFSSIKSETIFLSHNGPGTEYYNNAMVFSSMEKITPWLGADTANHYQWYPFINIGHYELAKKTKQLEKQFSFNWWSDTITGYYKEGIQLVWHKAKQNAFYRGIPFIWCSNNLTTSFAIQCYWYRELTGDTTFAALEQANFDWLFGCNPWGTSMVYGLPSWGDTPEDPHSAFTHLKNYPIDGGLVDGPVYGSIYNNLIGIQLYQPDEYATLQSDLAVYHDDYGDYSTNEPTMDGTASLIYLLAAMEAEAASTNLPNNQDRLFIGGASASLKKNFSYSQGAIIRGDSTKKNIALVFTGHEYADGGDFIYKTLQQEKIKTTFFLTGDFYRNKSFKNILSKLNKANHQLGPHSDKHLLYCDWSNRDSLLITRRQFRFDLADNYTAMSRRGLKVLGKKYFLPPFEWYNDSISKWTKEMGLQLINFTPGTRSNADYTIPSEKNYRSSDEIYNSIIEYEQSKPSGLNGFMLLIHIGTAPERTDKFYLRLPQLIAELRAKGYQFQTVKEILKTE